MIDLRILNASKNKQSMQQEQSHSRSRSGFTIVELMIVIVVIALLAAITLVAYNAVKARAFDSQRSSNVSSIAKIIAASQVTEGGYRPEMFLSGDGMGGGSLEVENVARLNELGLDPKIMRNPSAPEGIANSFVFNEYVYQGEESGGQLSTLPNDTTVTMYLPKAVPTGYSSWDDFWDDYYTTFDEFSNEYTQTHPFPENYEDEEAWYEAYEVAFAAEHPEMASIYAEGDSTEVDMPKTSVYIVDVLGATTAGTGYCNFEYAGEDYRTYQCTGPLPDDPESWGHIPITGIRISYYNQTSGTWQQKQVGSGNAFGDYENYF